MNIKTNLTIPVILAGAIASVIVFLVSFAPVTTNANSFTATTIGTATTSAAVAVTTSTRVLATTTNSRGNGTSYTRVYATLCNPSATLVYLNLNGDKVASLPGGTFTTVIAAAAGYDACFEITDRNLYQGSVTASSTNQTSVNVYVTDYVQ